MHNDTLVYTFGEKQAVHISKETGYALKYDYLNDEGKSLTRRVSISNLESFAIYDENNKLVITSVTGKSKRKLSRETKRAGVIVGSLAVGAGLLVGAGILVLNGLSGWFY